MALTDGDKAIVREIAWEVSDTIMERIEKRQDEQIEAHQSNCPTGRAVSRAKWLFVGIAIGAGLVGSSGTFAALKLFKVF